MMGKLDYTGKFWIKRKNKWIAAWCPFTLEDCQCGNHCALFEEPIYTPTGIKIGLCHKTLVFDVFEDERL